MTVAASFVVWAHIAALVAAIGGSAFAFLILRPLALKTLEPPVAMRFMGALQQRFRWVVWGSILVFIVTGLWSSWAFCGITSLDALFDTSFGRTLAVKSLLAVILFASALSITLPLPGLAWFRQRQATIFWINVSLAAVIVLLASLMVRRGGVF